MAISSGDNGRFRQQYRHRGGIFLSVLLFFSLTSCLLLLVLEDERLTSNFTIRTTNLYQAKIMKELFLMDYYSKDSELASTGKRTYNKETLSYEGSNEKVIIIVKMKNGYYRFEETVMDKKE
ncbi:competence type IV pilus minor pilin ComGG [Enterococcus gallinarum]|uniref:competence type IV pilus minor pilin ComGG n=1 Tax=Enterococcus gallinarum TaxID=1353 RepID=UPI00224C0489|nr:competence type IV pilus minor pilin ComGG [Enterococcus gallinarum]